MEDGRQVFGGVYFKIFRRIQGSPYRIYVHLVAKLRFVEDEEPDVYLTDSAYVTLGGVDT